jgi:sugar lactone lactonase YvrE
MKKNFRLKSVAVLSLALSLSLPTAALAATDTGWTKSPRLYEVHTWAGKSELGHANGSLNVTTFFHPHSAIALPDGRLLVTDTTNHLIRILTTTGSANYSGLDMGQDEANLPLGAYNDDVLSLAAFNNPTGLTIDAQGIVYIADSENNAIRRISKDGKVTTLAGNGNTGLDDGVGAKATFFKPSDVAVDNAGNVFVADTLNHVIRKISAEGTVKTLTAPSARNFEYFPGAVENAGEFLDGPIASAKFNEPSGLAIDAKGNLYVSDRGNQRIRYIDFSAGTVSTVAGGGTYASTAAYVEGDYIDGAASESRLNAPEGLTVTADGAVVFADSLNHVIRILQNGKVSTLAGSEFGKENGVTTSAQFNHPTDVTLLADGRLVIVDEFGNKIRILEKYTKPDKLPADKGIFVLYNGVLVPTTVPAQLKSNAVLLPLRSVGDALGYLVDYDKKTGDAHLTKGDTVYTIGNGKKTVTKTVNGISETLTLNAAAFVYRNSLFLPVRFFAAENNLDIQWDAAANLVVMRSKTFN